MIVKLVLSSEPLCSEEPMYVCRSHVLLDADAAVVIAARLRESFDELSEGTGNYGAIQKANLCVTLYTVTETSAGVVEEDVWDEAPFGPAWGGERPATKREWEDMFNG